MVSRLIIKLKRAYHRWCLTNAIAYHNCRVVSYNPSTNSFVAMSKDSNWMYHVYVDAKGEIIFRGLDYA